MIEIRDNLDLAWASLEKAIIVAYDDGYSGLVWQLKQAQLQIEGLETAIMEKEYGEEDE